MPRVKPENRKRAKRPKTRTGCRTCKIRRVKCDEARPNCERCSSTGRTCDGYEVPVPDEGALLGILPLSHLPPSVFKSAKEHRSFSFYLNRTSYQIAGHQECEFWNRIVLQAANEDPAIRYAVIALGSFHEAYEQTGEAERIEDDFALQQYDLAIRYHLEHLTCTARKVDRIDSYVASSMIFICIELLQGHYLSALSLIKGAVKLFYDQCTSISSAWPFEIFETILSRLQSQAVGMLSRHAVGQTIPPRLKNKSSVQIPEQFQSVAEARQNLEFYNHSQMLYSKGLKASFEPDGITRDTWFSMLVHWRSAFERMVVATEAELTVGDWQAANVLRIWHILIQGNLELKMKHPSDNDNQELYDEYESSFREIVRLAENILKETETRARGPSESLHRFTVDLGLVGPLYDTARICRDPIIRRQAIHLLRAYPCREGLWDSLLAASSAEKQMELEEAAVPKIKTAADVPGWARISSAMPTFQLGQRWTSVVYVRQKPLDGSEPLNVREIIRW